MQGKIDKLTSYIDTGKVSNLSHLDQALENIESVFSAVFDRRWKGCNDVVLEFLQTPAVQFVPTDFPIAYLEMAIATFNNLLQHKFARNPEAPTHPPDVASVPNVILLWKALLDPVVSVCQDPIKINLYYRLYEYNGSLGRVPNAADLIGLSAWGRTRL